MDAIEIDAILMPLRTGLQQLAAKVKAEMKRDAKTIQARAGVAC